MEAVRRWQSPGRGCLLGAKAEGDAVGSAAGPEDLVLRRVDAVGQLARIEDPFVTGLVRLQGGHRDRTELCGLSIVLVFPPQGNVVRQVVASYAGDWVTTVS